MQSNTKKIQGINKLLKSRSSFKKQINFRSNTLTTMFRITCCITIVYAVFHSMVVPSVTSMEIDSSASADWRKWNSYFELKKSKVSKVLYFRKKHKISFIAFPECVYKKLINKWANSEITLFTSSFWTIINFWKVSIKRVSSSAKPSSLLSIR